MKDAVKTIGAILDKQSTVYIGSVDEEGFPNTKGRFYSNFGSESFEIE